MRTTIDYSPAYAAATVDLERGEQLRAESGAMVAMQDVGIETGVHGGLMKGLRRKVLGGESFFVNTFTAGERGGRVMVAPSLPGDVAQWVLQDETLLVQSGSFLACAASVEVDSSWGGARTFGSREGLFVLKVSGRGDLLLSAYGAMHSLDLAEGETWTVDTGHMVAWSQSVRYEVRRVGGWRSSLTSGEGLVCDLTGPGRIVLQTRSEDAFLSWLIPKLPRPNAG